MATGRIIGVDYGRKRVGLAVSDPLQRIAFPLCTLSRGEVLSYLQAYHMQVGIVAFVLGYPLSLDNKPTLLTAEVSDFGRCLQRIFQRAIAVHFLDERYTSKIAARLLHFSGARRKVRERKHVLDVMSATIILRDFLAIHSNRPNLSAHT